MCLPGHFKAIGKEQDYTEPCYSKFELLFFVWKLFFLESIFIKFSHIFSFITIMFADHFICCLVLLMFIIIFLNAILLKML